jgi:hypothetical protein
MERAAFQELSSSVACCPQDYGRKREQDKEKILIHNLFSTFPLCTQVEGHPIADDGTVEFREDERLE